MNEIKAAIFDLDGVIVDTAKYHYLAWKSLADELNIPFNETDNERLKGVSRMQSLEIILSLGKQKNFSDEEKEKLATVKNNRYVEYIKKIDGTELLKGAKEYIKALKSMGIKTALGSASKNAGLILANTGIADLFDFVVDGNIVSKAKPDPEVFLKAAEGVKIAPENCVVFEDSFSGIEAAKSAGMAAIGVGSKNVLNRADYIIKGLFEAPLNFDTV